MSKQILFALSFLLAAACSSAPGSENQVSGGQAETSDAVTACDVDADCVAISRGGCCPNGWLTAVNSKQVDAYAAAHACAAPIICPMYIVNDKRHASCNGDTKACEMIAVPDDATSN